ncbi:MAG: hypothetical protein KM310_09325 [Clostridiales bacterium]|nr:hypothetical protein [Clostridiales bacterium]
MFLAGSEDRDAAKARILGLPGPLRGRRPGEAIQKLFQGLPKVESRGRFWAHLLALLIPYVRGLGEGTARLVEGLVRSAPGAEMRLIMSVGVVVGTVIQSPSHNLSLEPLEMVGRFRG